MVSGGNEACVVNMSAEESGYRKACRHMIERLTAMETDKKNKHDRIFVDDDRYGCADWFVRLDAAIGVAEDLLAESEYWA